MKKKILFFLLFFLFSLTSVKAIPDDAVVEMNGSYYNKISTAINEAPNNTKTTITLVKDRIENITISNTKNIVLDLNGYTLSNNGTGDKATVVTNNGILELKNGTITSDAASGMINNNKDAVLTITSGSYIATGSKQVLYNNAGNATISGNVYLESNSSIRAAVHNLNNGNLTIVGGTIVANNLYAVYNEKGTLNIGTEDDIFDKNKPVIQGKTYGVIANYKFNFYDGIIKGGTYHLGKSTTGNTPTIENDVNETKVEGIEEFSEKLLDEEEIGGETFSTFTYDLDSSSIIKVTFDPSGGTVSTTSKKLIIGNSIGSLPIAKKVDNSFDGWFTSSTGGDLITENTKPDSNITYYAHWTYVDPNTVAYVEGIGLMSLEDAFATGGNIRLEKDVIVPSSLVMNKEATLDLNGHTISLENKTIRINEKVTITDSSTNQTGKITSNANFGIIVGDGTNPTNGYLIHKGGTIEGLGKYGAIVNYETVEIDGGTVQGTATDSGYVIYNSNNLIMKSGTVYSTNGRAIQLFENSTLTMDGGLVKTDAIDDQAINLYGNCSATINGGTVEGLAEDTAAIAMFGNTNLVVNGGTIKGYSMGIAGNGRVDSANANITINGGDIIGTAGVGMYLPQRDSTTIINGGNISGPTGIEIRSSKLIINDGNIEGTSDTFNIEPNDNGTTSKGIAVAVVQHTSKQPIEVEINGGNLKAKVPVGEGNPLGNAQEYIDQISVTIYDGDFESTGNSSIYAENPETIIQLIKGGIYTYDPSEFVNDDYGAVQLPDNTYEVTKKYNITIDSSGSGFISIDNNKQPYKSTVKLNISERVINPIVEIYDTNGNRLNIEIKDNKFIMPEMDIVVKMTFDDIINPSTGDNIGSYILLLSLSIIGLLCVRIYKVKVKDI